MKKILLALAIAITLIGCKTSCNTNNDYNYATNSTTNVIVRTYDFNEEQYVWESFNFSTNKVENAK